MRVGLGVRAAREPMLPCSSVLLEYKECYTSPGILRSPMEHCLDASAPCLGQLAATSPVQVPVISDGRGLAEQESRGQWPMATAWELAAVLSCWGLTWDQSHTQGSGRPKSSSLPILCSRVSAAGEERGPGKTQLNPDTHGLGKIQFYPSPSKKLKATERRGSSC